VKRYVVKGGSNSVRSLLGAGLPATSRFSEVEIVSALAWRFREGAFSATERDRAIGQVRQDFRTLSLVEVTSAVVEKAKVLLARHPLLPADALQLGSCLELQERFGQPVSFAVFDERLIAAARAEGLAMPELVSSAPLTIVSARPKQSFRLRSQFRKPLFRLRLAERGGELGGFPGKGSLRCASPAKPRPPPSCSFFSPVPESRRPKVSSGPSAASTSRSSITLGREPCAGSSRPSAGRC
jgi:hypothetical protein